MKKKHYYFDMPEETYNFIIKKDILKERKNRTQFVLFCLVWYNYLKGELL